jgi:nicotinamide-nucleotide amidase
VEEEQRPVSDAVAELARRLLARGLTVATAESCTGGGLAAALTDLAGSSRWFERGWVTYSNAAKVADLGVAEATLAIEGAVSEAVVREMAEGARQRSGATLAVSISGIAGPDGGTPAKPVGLVCFGLARTGQPARAWTCQFSGGRAGVRAASVQEALRALLEAAG